MTDIGPTVSQLDARFHAAMRTLQRALTEYLDAASIYHEDPAHRKILRGRVIVCADEALNLYHHAFTQ